MSISSEEISISSDATSISSEEIAVVADAIPIFLTLRPLFCEPEAIVADAGAYLFYAEAIVAKTTSFSFEAETLIYVVGGIKSRHGVLFFTEHLPRLKRNMEEKTDFNRLGYQEFPLTKLLSHYMF